jgi:hypothetical protein
MPVAAATKPDRIGETRKAIDPADLDAPTRPRRRRRGLSREALPAVAAMAALILLLGGLAVYKFGSGDPRSPVAGGGPSSGGTAAASESPSPAADSGPTSASMKKFVEDYLAAAPKDPHTSFAELTPNYQQQSGGFDGYERFWGTVASAEPTSIKADPQDLTVSFLAKYRLRNGKQRTDGVTLHLIFNGTKYLIDGDDSRQVSS